MAESLGEWFATADERSPRLLMLFDLDGFKSYNDTFGHPAGDALLAHLGHEARRRRWRPTARPTGSAATSSAPS